MTSVSSRSWLLLRRQGALCAVAHGALDRVPGGSSPSIALKDGRRLQVDEILSLTAGLEPRPVPRVAAPYLPAAVSGLALWRHEPVALIGGSADHPSVDDGQE